MKKVPGSLWNLGPCCVYILNLVKAMDPKFWLYQIYLPIPKKDSQVWMAELCQGMAAVKEVAIGAVLRVGSHPKPEIIPYSHPIFLSLTPGFNAFVLPFGNKNY